jgi:cysteine desulfuration protein SufE
MRFDRLISRFQSADRNIRLETLLDYSKKLPPLPERYQAAIAAGGARVPECQTPVYLWVEAADDGLHFHAEVPRESPTVRGYVSLLLKTLEGATPVEVADVPDDLLERLRLVETLGMMRVQGLTAILARVKRLAGG